MTGLNAYPALVLNADFQPLQFCPASRWPWERVVTAVLDERVSVVAEYDRVVRSPSFEMALPSIIALRSYVDLNRPAAMLRMAPTRWVGIGVSSAREAGASRRRWRKWAIPVASRSRRKRATTLRSISSTAPQASAWVLPRAWSAS